MRMLKVLNNNACNNDKNKKLDILKILPTVLQSNITSVPKVPYYPQIVDSMLSSGQSA